MHLKHVLSVDQFSLNQLNELCNIAQYYETTTHTRSGADSLREVHNGKILTNLFYEPSTRTSSSFHSAMLRLGGEVIPINNVTYSSVSKGETLEDTIRTMACNTDAIALRHPEAGAAMRAAAVSPIPIINAGDGDNEHPTQALLDYYTIRKHYPDKHDLHVVMMGDLVHGRTVKSLAKLLRKESDVRITWVSPPDLRIQNHFLRAGEIETEDLMNVINQADVVYLTRVQLERGSRAATYGVTPEHMSRAKSNMILMHPLPRLSELPTILDSDPRSVYFKQIRNGLYMRMAILTAVL